MIFDCVWKGSNVKFDSSPSGDRNIWEAYAEPFVVKVFLSRFSDSPRFRMKHKSQSQVCTRGESVAHKVSSEIESILILNLLFSILIMSVVWGNDVCIGSKTWDPHISHRVTEAYKSGRQRGSKKGVRSYSIESWRASSANSTTALSTSMSPPSSSTSSGLEKVISWAAFLGTSSLLILSLEIWPRSIAVLLESWFLFVGASGRTLSPPASSGWGYWFMTGGLCGEILSYPWEKAGVDI